MNGSYWQREAGWRDQWCDEALPSSVDFAVLGGGLSGLCTAIELRKLAPSAHVLVLEAERVGYGASGRNAGFLSPLAAPVWLLGADRSVDHAWAARHLNSEVHGVAQWLHRCLPQTQIQPAALSIEATGWLSRHGLCELSRLLEIVGLDHRLADSRRRPGHLSLEMDAHMVQPYELVRALAERATSEGVFLRERARVRTVEDAPAGASVVLDDGKRVLSRRVIICTNAYTSSVDIRERVRALAVHSFMVASERLTPAQLRDVVLDGDFTVELNKAEAYHRLHEGRILYGGMDKVLPPRDGDFAAPARVKSHLAKHMGRSFPSVGRFAVAGAWGGRFHATTTGLPIIRRSTRSPAVILNVGYGGTGVALTMVCARLVAAVASGGEPANPDDRRLLATIQGTRVPVGDGVRAMSRLVRRLMGPSLGP